MRNPAQVTPALLALTDRYASIPGSHRSFVRTLQKGISLFGSKDVSSMVPVVGKFDRPTLVGWGRQDRIFPTACAKRAAAILPQPVLCLIDACGHYPHWEPPAVFAAAR